MSRRNEAPTATTPDIDISIERNEYDWTSIAPSTAVMETVAAATGCEATAFGPLYETIDTDALDAVVRSMQFQTSDDQASVSFGFDGIHVSVHGRGLVVVQPAEAES